MASPHKISTGWSYSFSWRIFTITEVKAAVSLVYRIHPQSLANVCNVVFTGSAYPDISFHTSAQYNVPGLGVDRWWAVARYTARHRGQIIFNTSARMNGRWEGLWPNHADKIAVLNGLVGHETSHLMLASMSQDYGFPPSSTYIYWLQRYYGKPKVKTMPELELASFAVQLAESEELDSPPSLWSRMKRLMVPEKHIVVPDRDDMTAEEFRRMIGMV